MIYRFGPFTLDEGTLELRCGDVVVELRRQAYDTLVYLLRHRDRVVSKRELLEKVWEGRIVTENSLAQAITGIRRALGSDGRDYVRTMYGWGFRFMGPVAHSIPSFPTTWSPRGDPTGHRSPAPAADTSDGSDSEPLGRAVAVLPFATVGDDPQEVRFGQGLSEDLVRCLYGWSLFPVISAGSTWSYGDAARSDLRRIAEELAAPYVVTGRVQTQGDRVRVRVSLNEAATLKVLWNERYDEPVTDFFALQDEVAEKITAHLVPEVVRAEIDALERRPPPTLDAWQTTLLGLTRFYRDLVDDETLQHFEAAHTRDPRFVLPHFYSGYVHHLRVYYQLTDAVEESLARVREAAARCLSIDPLDPSGHMLRGLSQMVAGDPYEAVHCLERAVELNPSLAEARSLLGQLLGLRGRGEEGVHQARLALRLSPRDPRRSGFLSALAIGHFAAGRYEDAARCAEHSTRDRPDLIPNYLCIASCSGILGDHDRAERAVERLRRLGPEFSAHTLDRLLASAMPEIREQFWEGIQRAGFKRP